MINGITDLREVGGGSEDGKNNFYEILKELIKVRKWRKK